MSEHSLDLGIRILSTPRNKWQKKERKKGTDSLIRNVSFPLRDLTAYIYYDLH